MYTGLVSGKCGHFGHHRAQLEFQAYISSHLHFKSSLLGIVNQQIVL